MVVGGYLREERVMLLAPSRIKIRKDHHLIHEVTQERPMDLSRDRMPSITCSIVALTKSSASSSVVILVLVVATPALAVETLAEAMPVAEVEAIPGVVGSQVSPHIPGSKRGSLTQANRRRE